MSGIYKITNLNYKKISVLSQSNKFECQANLEMSYRGVNISLPLRSSYFDEIDTK